MPTSLKAIAQSHADHRHWKGDLEMWTNDIVNWKAEQTDALAELRQIEDEIREHGKALDDHGLTLEQLDRNLDAHEKTLAAAVQSATIEDLDGGLCEYHEKQASLYAQQREAHERIKRHHHRAMAQVAILKAAMEAAM